jgi:hypothetical protein
VRKSLLIKPTLGETASSCSMERTDNDPAGRRSIAVPEDEVYDETTPAQANNGEQHAESM